MRPGYGLFQQQAMRMRMTPELQQAIKLLQLSTPELLECVRQELLDNPALESTSDLWDSHTDDTRGTAQEDAEYDPLQRAAVNEASLERILMEQLGFIQHISQPVRAAVTYMIGNLDPNGYLEPTLEEIAQTLQIEPIQAEQALRILQSFEPAGIGAGNLRECLLLQLGQLPYCPPLAQTLVTEHLDKVARLSVQHLAERIHATTSEVQEALAVIKGLNPRPGAAFHSSDVKYITPDLIIEKREEQFVVSVHEAAAPRLSVNRHFKEEGDRYQSYINSASFFAKCIEQRRATLLQVTTAIVEEQSEFLLKGIPHLKPMNLETIADKVGLHVSTISRATSGKYAQTPWGVFELTFFFPQGLHQQYGDGASAESVKARMKEHVEREDDRKPLSDQALAQLLEQDGIKISRRTVTKYREELGIASSVKRKR